MNREATERLTTIEDHGLIITLDTRDRVFGPAGGLPQKIDWLAQNPPLLRPKLWRKPEGRKIANMKTGWEHPLTGANGEGNRRDDVASSLVSLSSYRRQLGRSKATLWRYRKLGWLKCVNVLGKLYVTREAIAEFEARVLNGDLAKEPHGCAAGSPAAA
jgi:hypothetical protein